MNGFLHQTPDFKILTIASTEAFSWNQQASLARRADADDRALRPANTENPETLDGSSA